QAELGKPMRNCYSLPGFDFAYGLYVPRRDGGVAEAIGHWDTVKPRIIKKIMPRDFITMNRGAVEAGCTTAREFALYHKFMDIRLKEEDGFPKARLAKMQNMTVGMPPRPPTPMFDLLQHRYKELWMEEQRAQTVVQRVEKKKLDKVRENHTASLRTPPPPVKEESFWHPSRFEKVEPHLSTFPDPDTRKKALSA
ncbi:CFA77 protein, partial [Serilophus lunatus]|nr:CFA77 protein [Serilophus lunatus]